MKRKEVTWLKAWTLGDAKAGEETAPKKKEEKKPEPKKEDKPADAK